MRITVVDSSTAPLRVGDNALLCDVARPRGIWIVILSCRMSNPYKSQVLDSLRSRFGEVRKVMGSESLFVVGSGYALIYFRYSKVFPGGRTFFGLREMDLRRLEGHNSYLCFLLGDGSSPLFIPYSDFEEIFHGAEPAADGQYKVQLYKDDTLQLYIARRGRFNVEGYVGMHALERTVGPESITRANSLSHSQVQTLLAGLGHLKGYDVWVPDSDAGRLDWSLTRRFQLRPSIPAGFEAVREIISCVDVVWVASGRNTVEGLYEVEHSTPVYSGLLRFNDILLTDPRLSRFSIVSNDTRRSLFSRQLFRPTFRKSGLAELCSFLEYANVIEWHQRLSE